MKPFQHWSATQVTTFRLCQRKWYLSKIVGLEQPVTQALLDGKKFAEEAERFFKTGEIAHLSATTRPLVALAASGKIPGPLRSTLRVEHPIGVDRRATDATGAALLEVDGLPAEGYMDLLDLKAGYPVVWDQKPRRTNGTSKSPTSCAQMCRWCCTHGLPCSSIKPNMDASPRPSAWRTSR